MSMQKYIHSDGIDIQARIMLDIVGHNILYLPYLCVFVIFSCITLHYKYITLCIFSTQGITPIPNFHYIQ